MKLLHTLVLALCLCAVSAYIPYRIINKYAMKKATEGCFGKEVMADVRDEMLAAHAKCTGHDVSHQEEEEDAAAIEEMIDSMEPQGERQKRSIFKAARSHHHVLTLKKMQKMKLKVDNMFANVTCVMREMKFLDAENELDLVSMRERFERMNLPEAMTKDLKEGMDKCSAFAACLPSDSFEKSKVPTIRNFSRQLLFFKCFEMVKMESCMKQDFRTDYLPKRESQGEDVDEKTAFETMFAAKYLKGFLQES